MIFRFSYVLWLNKLSVVIRYFRVDDGSICVDGYYKYWTIIILIRVLTYVQKTLGKISEMCNCLLLFRMYFIMWNLFLFWSECSLWRCSCWPIAKSCMIPFICKFIGFNFSLMSSARFLSFWIGVLISHLGISEVSAICFSDWFSISS